MSEAPRYAVFVSPHGFGHAARASAVMEALHERSGARFELFTTVPRWFFDESVQGVFNLHPVVCDVGLAQASALASDGAGTVERLAAMLPFDDALLDRLAGVVVDTGCRGVLCDIAPMGIAVAERAGIPSILIENFTWGWLYQPMVAQEPRLGALGDQLEAWFSRATLHLLSEPFCFDDPRAAGAVRPISRPARRTRAQVRDAYGLPLDAPMVVVTMGGVGEAMPFLSRLRAMEEVHFVVTGAERTETSGNLHLFDNATRIYMPDLVRGADAVIAKLGYSTLAEVWREGRPLAFVTRADFREVPPLRRWASERLPGFEIPGVDFAGGDWIARIPELLAARTPEQQVQGGADEAAGHVLTLTGWVDALPPPTTGP